MNIVQQNPGIAMARPTLDDLPAHPLPPGFTLRRYTPGDIDTWVHVQTAAERYITITPQLHINEFTQDHPLIADRQYFLLDPDHQPIGTATAWFDGTDPANPTGRVHWVAIIPEYQSQGLAKPLLAEVCRQLKSLHHTRAILGTSAARLPAINLYLRFGFAPVIAKPDDQQIWRQLAEHIPHLPPPPWLDQSDFAHQ